MTSRSDDPTAPQGESPPRNVGQTEAAQFLDPEIYRDFVDLMGWKQARFWLEKFRLGLSAELEHSYRPDRDPATSRENIHQTCARAGIIGFTVLHQACLAFLEAGGDPADPENTYRTVCTEAARVMSEIERQSALLS